MKHLKYYKTFERILADFTLYHGSPYLFENFKIEQHIFQIIQNLHGNMLMKNHSMLLWMLNQLFINVN